MDESAALKASYITEDGYERFTVSTILDRPLIRRLDDHCAEQQVSRSDAIRRILHTFLST